MKARRMALSKDLKVGSIIKYKSFYRTNLKGIVIKVDFLSVTVVCHVYPLGRQHEGRLDFVPIRNITEIL